MENRPERDQEPLPLDARPPPPRDGGEGENDQILDKILNLIVNGDLKLTQRDPGGCGGSGRRAALAHARPATMLQNVAGLLDRTIQVHFKSYIDHSMASCDQADSHYACAYNWFTSSQGACPVASAGLIARRAPSQTPARTRHMSARLASLHFLRRFVCTISCGMVQIALVSSSLYS